MPRSSLLHVPTWDLRPLISPLMEKWGVSLEKPLLSPPSFDDFDFPLSEIIVAAEVDDRKLDREKTALAGKEIFQGVCFKSTPRDLEEVAVELGVAVRRTERFYYPRDCFLRNAEGEIVLPSASPFAIEGVARVRSSALYFGSAAASRTNNQLFNGWSGVAAQAMEPIEDFHFFSSAPKILPYSYIEGGNLFLRRNGEGELSACIGKDHLLQTFLSIELSGADWGKLGLSLSPEIDLQKRGREIGAVLTREKILETGEEMFSLGLLPIEGREGLIPSSEQLKLLLLRFFVEGAECKTFPLRDLAVSARLIPSFQWGDEKLSDLASLAAVHLSKKEIVKAVVARDLALPQKNVHWIAQANYHLDTFIFPAPSAAFFIVSYRFLAELLEQVASAADLFSLADEDKALLRQYIDTARKLDRELSPLLLEAEQTLKGAGFQVIPVPFHIACESETAYKGFPIPDLLPMVHFGNAISGFSSALNSPFYIAHGISAGEKLGCLFMDLFALVLRFYSPDVALYFIGRGQNPPFVFSEAADCWGRVDAQWGIHCTTFPLSGVFKKK